MVIEPNPYVEPSKPESDSNSIENDVQLESSIDGEDQINDPGIRLG